MPVNEEANRRTDATTVGSYFVSNYPPYAYWNEDNLSEVRAALDREPVPGVPLGLYLHIPFCRKRCRFCYFKVYTDKDSTYVNNYLESLIQETKLYAGKAAVAGRKPKFIYFGGGTPSFISTKQLSHLVDSIRPLLPWDEAEEIAFECEPGTITKRKLEILRDIGITRLSLGVENFTQEILEINGRAHGTDEIARAYDFAQEVGFPQINIDLIAGMIGETEENWRENVSKAIELEPDSLTIYQMEVPPNTVISKEMREDGREVAPVADWGTKRAWAGYAFAELERAGYTLTSGYTAVKDPAHSKFLYRDLLWSGADMLGLGVASFSHMQGIHFQNATRNEVYQAEVDEGRLPIYRALKTTKQERMIREFILQMKRGRVDARYLESKYGTDVRREFAGPLESLESDGYLEVEQDVLKLTRDGLMRVDQLLHQFFLPEHRPAVAA